MSEKLTDVQGRTLLELARAALKSELSDDQSQLPADLQERLRDPAFDQKLGTFVTLHLKGSLRGCIGSLEGTEPLRDNVHKNAINAAFRDPRFPPLGPNELPEVDIEVSVLTSPSALEFSSPRELTEKLRPGVDGVILKKGLAQSTFLPQVWEQLPQPEAFLSNLCQKAGLSFDAWEKEEVQILTYQVQSFAEKEG